MKTTAYRSLDLIDLPQIKTKKPAKPQNSAKNAGKANKQIGNIKISHDMSTNKDAEIQQRDAANQPNPNPQNKSAIRNGDLEKTECNKNGIKANIAGNNNNGGNERLANIPNKAMVANCKKTPR